MVAMHCLGYNEKGRNKRQGYMLSEWGCKPFTSDLENKNS